MHCQCDGRPTVTFPVAGHHRRLTGTRLCCLVTEADTCETSLPKAVTWQLNGQELDSAKSRVSPKNCTTSPQVLVNESADLYCCCWCIKGVQYSSLQLASLLQELTCHMGSHNLTCHRAEVTFHLTPAEAGTRCSNPGGIQDWVDLALVRTLFCRVAMFGCLESHYQRIWVSTVTCPLSARSPSTGYVSFDESAVHLMLSRRRRSSMPLWRPRWTTATCY